MFDKHGWCEVAGFSFVGHEEILGAMMAMCTERMGHLIITPQTPELSCTESEAAGLQLVFLAPLKLILWKEKL